MLDITNIFLKNKDWTRVLKICQRLHQQGYQAYLAGGCVRDALLGRVAADFDIATNARPEVVESLFEKTIPVGKDFGVVMVVLDGVSFEVATFRADGPYKDGRRPENVVFCSAEEDAARRDFTVNAMFFDVQTGQILDYFSGLKDLQAGVIKAVGEPRVRFAEDHLRLLRAIRFAAQLNFSVEDQTFRAIQTQASGLRQISRERVLNESQKLLLSAFPSYGFHLLMCSQLLPYTFPESWKFSNIMCSELKHFVAQITGPGRWVQCLSLFMLSLQGFKPKASEVRGALEPYTNNKKDIKSVEEVMSAWVKLLSSERKGEVLQVLDRESGLVALSLLEIVGQKTGGECEQLREMFLSVAEPNGHLPAPEVNGHDLIEAGYAPGPEMAGRLKSLYWKQLEEGLRD